MTYHALRTRLGAAFLAGCMAAPVAVSAAPILDPANDFIASFTGAHSGDIDVISTYAIYDGTAFHIGGTMNGAIGTLPTSLYVFGFNRGTGTAGFAAIGVGNVLFDAVITMTGAGVLGGRLLPEAAAINVATMTKTITGSSFQIDIPAILLPARGLTPDHYGINLWPRDTSQVGAAAVSDFAPDNATFIASAPEPLSIGLFASGLVCLMAAVRRRSV